MASEPLTIMITFRLKPGYATRLFQLLAQMKAHLEQEDHLDDIIILQDKTDADVVYLLERWNDRAAFETVMPQRSYLQDFLSQIPDLLSEPQTISHLQLVDVIARR
jgi:quinol monooxygenase YgiN